MIKSTLFKSHPIQALVTALFLLLSANGVNAKPGKEVPGFPSLVLCTQRGHVVHVNQNKIDWEYDGDGQAREVQPQPIENRVLVVGGPRQVYLIRKVDSGVRVIWDWSALEGVSIVSAVAADWNLKGEPSLILGAESLGKRLVLAEAKSTGVKIRWEYALPTQPVKVKLCPDDGNFLVLLADGSVEEIQFREDKLAWQWNLPAGSDPIQDVLRGPSGNTFALQSDGEVLCVNPDKNILWKSQLPFQNLKRKLELGALSFCEKKGRRWLMVSVHDNLGPGATDLTYLLDAESGKAMNFSDHLGKEAYPPLVSAVPDEPSCFRKE